jgi:hypothetical protein
VFAVFLWCGDVSGEDPAAGGPDRQERTDPKAYRTADPDGTEDLPLEWIAEILENQEMFESLDLLDKYELFEGGDRFSPHRFE